MGVPRFGSVLIPRFIIPSQHLFSCAEWLGILGQPIISAHNGPRLLSFHSVSSYIIIPAAHNLAHTFDLSIPPSLHFCLGFVFTRLHLEATVIPHHERCHQAQVEQTALPYYARKKSNQLSLPTNCELVANTFVIFRWENQYCVLQVNATLYCWGRRRSGAIEHVLEKYGLAHSPQLVPRQLQRSSAPRCGAG